MIDIFGEELQIGDSVVCCNQNYATLCVGTITGFTAKRIRVKYVRPDFSDGNYGYQREQLKKRFQVCKVKSDFDLINRQQAQNGVYETCNARKDETINSLESRLKTANAEIERLKYHILQVGKMVKSEAIKEFAERLKNILFNYYDSDIDNLLKEMAGEK